MSGYEYKVIPAPAKGLKAPGVKGAEARFAHALEQRMNEMATDGWEYLRADILPSEERQGLTSTQTVYRSVLVFRRGVEASAAPDVTEEVEETPAATPEPEEPAEETATEAAETDEGTVSSDDDDQDKDKKETAT